MYRKFYIAQFLKNNKNLIFNRDMDCWNNGITGLKTKKVFL